MQASDELKDQLHSFKLQIEKLEKNLEAKTSALNDELLKKVSEDKYTKI